MGLAGSSLRSARLCWTHSHVPGSTCMTPRALAAETIALLKPLSCQAIAEASEAGTPLRLATMAMSEGLTRPGGGAGTAAGTTCGTDAAAGLTAKTKNVSEIRTVRMAVNRPRHDASRQPNARDYGALQANSRRWRPPRGRLPPAAGGRAARLPPRARDPTATP